MIYLKNIINSRFVLLLMYLTTTYAFTGNIGFIYSIYVILRYAMIILAGIGLLFWIVRIKNFGYIMSKHMALCWLSIISLSLVSLGVTNSVSGTISQLFWLLASIMFAWFFKETDFHTMLRVFLDGQLVILCLQVVALVIFPSSCFSSHLTVSVFQGSFYHKNALALQMVFGIIVCVCLWIDTRKNRENSTLLCEIIVVFAGSSVALLASGSGTAKSCLIAMTIVLLVCKLLKWKINVVAIILVYTIVFISLIFNQNNVIGNFLENVLHRDATLTGRLWIWERVLSIVEMHPWFGYGYNSFWEYNPVLAESALNMGAHNGLFELLLQLGYVGTAVVICVLLWLGNSIKRDMNEMNTEVLFQILFITMLLTYAIGERILVPFVYTTIILFEIIIMHIEKRGLYHG